MTKCPKCESVNIYPDQNLWICPDCGHEWILNESVVGETAVVWLDANKQILADGDTVVLIKDLKVRGATGALKKGTKVKNIRLIEPEDGHNISCKIEGFGAMNLKSEFLKKA